MLACHAVLQCPKADPESKFDTVSAVQGRDGIAYLRANSTLEEVGLRLYDRDFYTELTTSGGNLTTDKAAANDHYVCCVLKLRC
ncbi:hypothetical protein SAMN04490220_1008 [Rhodococcus jostii]|uniref:Uncharacterized protein n=1 Tax=Rhodococcus jostii TaxID=132919 RepID=A0A1H4JMZ0_RHOJO|nr:hypothetical protein SAMN04490220_1008 [Rhodococcus jostii]